jgi:thiol-disulfide isomerase/thioredoxin
VSDVSVRNRGGLIVVAAVLGALAGTVAVYVSETSSGNDEVTAAQCADALKLARTANSLARGEVAAFRASDTADSLGDLSFMGPDGKPTGLGAFAGKTVLLNFWATWCIPCRSEMPTLDHLAAERGGKDFAVVAVDLDVAEAAKSAPQFLSDVGATHLSFYSDPTLGVLNAIKKRGLAIGLPTTLLVDPNGCRIGVMEGPAVWDSPDAKALLDAAMRPSAPAAT